MNINGQPTRCITINSDGFIEIIDQTKLPHELIKITLKTLNEVIEAIQVMRVRGAPLIGATAAYGMVLAAQQNTSDLFLKEAAQLLCASRPTAVNLRWAVDRMLNILLSLDENSREKAAWQAAAIICDEDVNLNQAIGQHGLRLIQSMYTEKQRPLNILTHCNAGWLATVDWGTALAPIYQAFDAGVPLHVWVDETRPRNQGASLTAWELGQHGVPHTVIADNAGGHLMQHGQVDMVIVGADRVTRIGDVCNKIGTYLKALAAFDNGVPFYVAVPTPTIDWGMQDGLSEIPIEERGADELRYMQGLADDGSICRINMLPANSQVANPAFDVTPARLVTGIVTEYGVMTPANLLQLQLKP